MTIKERRLAADMLKEFSSIRADAGCNDVPDSTYNGWTDDEKKVFWNDIEQWNDKTAPRVENPQPVQDYALISYLASQLRKEAQAEETYDRMQEEASKFVESEEYIDYFDSSPIETHPYVD